MIAGEYHHPGAFELFGRAGALARRHPDRKVFEATERARRFGQNRLPVPGRRGGVGIGCGNVRKVSHLRRHATRVPRSTCGRGARIRRSCEARLAA